MAKLFVVPSDIAALLEGENRSLALLNDAEQIAQHLSANDIAEIHTATIQFPFEFDRNLDIQLAPSPLHTLMAQPGEKYQRLIERVQQRLDLAKLTTKVEAVETPRYSLNVVDGTLWVAVLQRQCNEEGNLDEMRVSQNQSFFSGLIAQVLHTLPFEAMCASNLFALYLKTLRTAPAV